MEPEEMTNPPTPFPALLPLHNGTNPSDLFLRSSAALRLREALFPAARRGAADIIARAEDRRGPKHMKPFPAWRPRPAPSCTSGSGDSRRPPICHPCACSCGCWLRACCPRWRSLGARRDRRWRRRGRRDCQCLWGLDWRLPLWI